MNSFGERLRAAFNNAKNAEIARKIGVSESAVKNYLDGRVPDGEKLVRIANLTNCNLHWLLTGQGVKFLGEEGFDLEYVIDEHEEWQDVLEEWYRWEGREMPADLGARFMRGWRGMSKQEKIEALTDLKELVDKTVGTDGGQ